MANPFRSLVLAASLAAGLSVQPAHAQPAPDALQDLRVDVVYLASDLLEGRQTGTPGEALAAQYIASRFEEIGLTTLGSEGWLQPFTFHYSDNPHAPAGSGEERIGHNVVGYLDRGAATTVIIGAHYDHLGHGGFGSREPDSDAIHNGADDNASGTAVLIELARRLAASPLAGNNYVFIAFSGEEMGLYGSKYFANNPALPLVQVNYMLNMDMVGRLNAEKVLAVNGTGTSPAWDGVLDGFAHTGLQVRKHASGIGASDHTSFYLQNLPVLHFFTGQHQEYHKPADDSELINYEGMHEVTGFIMGLIEALDGDDKLAFSETKDEDQGRAAASFKVSMGIMPDYVAEGTGVRVDAVIGGRPAAEAGLEKGDIIVKMDEVEIVDINAYMQALATYEKGDKATVVVKRGAETLTKNVQF
ncbi:MAG: M28 family peptidase [Rhodothermales bacterium]|nr:M28 family peptidase [Rhodothermales bacterium]